MRYLTQSFAYIKKTFLLYGMLALVPAILLGLFCTPLDTTIFWIFYRGNNVHNIGDMFHLVFNVPLYSRVYPLVIIVLSLIICCSLTYNSMETHMKVGKLTIGNPMHGVNYTVIPVSITLFWFILFINVLKFIVTVLAYVIHLLFINSQGSAFPVFLIAMMAVILVFLVVSMAFSMLLWIPAMIMSGYNFRDMAAYSIRLVQKNIWQLFISMAVPLSATIILLIVLAASQISAALLTVLSVAIYLFWILYLQSFSMIAYFDLTENERADLRMVNL
ncbi:MAG: hypothetical protein LBU60_04735 [Clostridiales bacterium]|jgi:hypothetical protein|nr:hypothetical protein [Clostridiales bacterium]